MLTLKNLRIYVFIDDFIRCLQLRTISDDIIAVQKTHSTKLSEHKHGNNTKRRTGRVTGANT